jgi:hypothetical protein
VLVLGNITIISTPNFIQLPPRVDPPAQVAPAAPAATSALEPRGTDREANTANNAPSVTIARLRAS